MNITLYEWQQKCLEKWIDNNTLGIAHIITGAGKTIMALSAAEYLLHQYGSSLRIYIVVPTLALMSQWKNTIEAYLSDFHSGALPLTGKYSGIHKSPVESVCTIYVINSARHGLARRIIKDMEQGLHILLIADECHHYGSHENSKIFHYLGSAGFNPELYSALGLSSTPFCRHFRDIIVPALGDIIYRLSYEDALSAGIISDFAVYETKLHFNAEELKKYSELSDLLSKLYGVLRKKHPDIAVLRNKPGNAFWNALKDMAGTDTDDICARYLNTSYLRQEIVNMAESRIACAISLIKKYPQSRIIIFAERIAQLKVLESALTNACITGHVSYHSGQSPEYRAFALAAFRDASARILITCKALDEGMDVPDADMGIVLSGTHADRQRIQRLGRILRRVPSKDIAVLYYFHIRESSEDEVYISDMDNQNLKICSLEYHTWSDSFTNPVYENLSLRLLEKYNAKSRPEQLAELRECLLEGYMSPDWLLDEAILDKRIANASNRHERNYYLVMKKIAYELVCKKAPPR